MIVDFSGAAGKSFLLFNNPDATAPYPDGDDVVPANVMLFKVTKRLSGQDTSSMPQPARPPGSRSTRGRRSRPGT